MGEDDNLSKEEDIDLNVTMNEVEQQGKGFRRCSQCNRYTFMHGPGYGKSCKKDILSVNPWKKRIKE